MPEDLRELVRQRLWLVRTGTASKSAEETADDILALIVERCAQIADGPSVECAEAAAAIRRLARKR
jgi:hypothetical protein